MPYEIVEELKMKRGGGGFEDESDNLDDMGYAERLVLNPEFIAALAKLRVVKTEGTTITGGAILISKSDLDFGEKKYVGEMNGAAHKINQVFVAMEIPFYANSYSTDKAEKTTRIGKRGKNKDIEYKVTLPDKLRIFRISENFEIDRYAADKSKKVSEEGINDYHEPTEGMRARVAKWIDENGADIFEDLKKIGMSVEAKE